MADFDRESMLDMFIYEMNQLLSNLETTILQAETGFTMNDINEVFRIMHTIKGSAAMMLYDKISTTAHSIEDMFFYLREDNSVEYDSSEVADAVLLAMDFIKQELGKIEQGEESDGDNTEIVNSLKALLAKIKGEASTTEVKEITTKTQEVINSSLKIGQRDKDNTMFDMKIYFEPETEMKNVRAFTVVSSFEKMYDNVTKTPEDLLDDSADDYISANGLYISLATDLGFDNVFGEIKKTVYMQSLSIATTASLKVNSITIEECNKHNFLLSLANPIGEYEIVERLIGEFEESAVRLEILDLPMIKDDADIQLTLEINVYSILEEEVFIDAFSRIDLVANVISNSNVEPVEEIVQANEPEEEVKVVEPQPVVEHVAEHNEIAIDVSKTPNDPSQKKVVANQVISVNVSKLDQLLNLMRELVISEAMVTQNSDLVGLDLENFQKDARQLHKIINDVQDLVMSMRMVPLSTAFFKMHRIVRDMSKQLNKEVELVIIGEETEVDKNIIEHISDPLMHMIRNSVDHGLESTEERIRRGKPAKGTVTLEAKNAGGDVLIIISDDGAGIDTEKVLEKAKKNGLLKKDASEYTEKEISNFIFQPGFSTNDEVTNYSGRGVGMDVVTNNLAVVGGTIDIDTVKGEGTTFTLKIPLTLAIIDGMNIKLGDAMYTIPIISIKQSLKARQGQITIDPDGNEMISIRDEVYNVIRLNEFFGLETHAQSIEDGIMILVENGNSSVCLFADELVGEHQVVVKSMPKYIKKTRGISGCTLLGNGDISIIIDTAGFFDK